MINTTTYLSRSQLSRLLNKNLSNDEIDDLIFSGDVTKNFSYYKATEKLLRKLKIIPNTVTVTDNNFGALAKQQSFTLKTIQDIFSCDKDTARIVARKYFIRKYNYFYKNDVLCELLNEGKQEYSI